jgi:predicted RNA-binding Zn-ribbon protein involved in translation (DUF1610 family)
VIPLRPLWIGLFADAIFFTAAWAILLVVLIGPAAMLRSMRLRGGRCIECGYDLRATASGNRCPECGAERTVASANGGKAASVHTGH